MKKIGILTFHRFLNYGGLLQAYALCSVLNKMGADASVIDYRCEALENVGNAKLFKKGVSYKRNIKKLLSLNSLKRKEKSFENFIEKNMKLTASMNEKDYDLLITGSDQVWNPKWPYDGKYFLDFVKDKNKKASYSASLGDRSIPDDKKEEYKSRLTDFNKISVREEEDVKTLTKLLNRSIKHTVDPVLLLDKSEWEKLLVPIKEKKYCLIYTVNEPEEVVSMAKKYAKEKNLKLIYLNPSFFQQFKPGNGKKIKDASPEEFISLMYNAEAVFTNSFHGTAFGVLFGKELYVETNSNGKINKRAADLLKIREQLEKYKQDSMEYLQDLVKEA